jgi:hypothetical protein
MSEKYFSDMIHDLGLGHHKDVTIAELFGSLSQKADPIFHSLYNMTSRLTIESFFSCL